MTNQEKKQCKFVIGIDLGHGETSAAICPLQWDALPSQLDPAKDLEMGGNKKVIPSAITILDNGTTYIGDAAFNPEILRQADVHVCFKKAPQDIHGEKEQLMIAFMREVYKRIRENNSGILADNNHQVFIATPSGWDKPTQDLYMQMAKEAGMPVAGLTKESRAAFVRAQSDTTSGIGRNIEKGAIVFDMGSSTLDFTYMNKNLPELIDFGYNCGASAVERAIYKHEYDEEESIKVFEKKYPRLIDYLVFESRQVKEKIYTDPTLKVKKTVNFEDIVDDEELEDERFRLVYQPGDLNKLLEENGYMKQIADAMIDFRMNHIPGQDIYGVFMTGGASRMDFLKPLIYHYFGVDEDHVYRDQDPSLTISQGVAMVARMDLRTEGMDEGLGTQIEELTNSSKIFSTFAINFTTVALQTIIDSLNSSILVFENSKEDMSMDDFNALIEVKLKNTMSRLTGNVSDHIRNAILENTSDFRKRVDDIVLVYTSQGNDIKLPKLNVPAISMGKIEIQTILDDIAKGLADETLQGSMAAGSFGGAAAGALIGSVVPGIGTIAGAIIGGALGLFGGGSEKPTIEKEKAKKRNSIERKKIADLIRSKNDHINQNILNTIADSVKSDNKVREAVRKATSNYLKEYKESLRNARVLID